MNRLSVVIPVFNEGASLPVLFEKLNWVDDKLKSLDLELQLIFVDDGSHDDSWAYLKNYCAKRSGLTNILRLSRNFGAVNASKTGLGAVTGDCFMLLAADLQDPPDLIVQMAEHWRAGEKFVVCARETRDDPISARVSTAIYYRLVRLMVHKTFPKQGFDMALMDRVFLSVLRDSGKHVNYAMLSWWVGIKPHIIGYARPRRLHGKSRWTLARKIHYFIDSLFMFSVAPIRAISWLGMTISVASFLFGIFIALGAVRGTIVVPGYASIMVALSFLLGLTILMLGIIGEYVWRISDQLNRRPDTLVVERIGAGVPAD